MASAAVKVSLDGQCGTGREDGKSLEAISFREKHVPSET
jgi:hypothetical protein